MGELQNCLHVHYCPGLKPPPPPRLESNQKMLKNNDVIYNNDVDEKYSTQRTIVQ
jgi:hypothetical protein